jgi:small subunit ribosomal protein S17
VEVTRRIPHRLYARFVNRRRKFHAHDETNQCHVGDQVRIVASRPLSKLKRWRLQEIIQKAKLITTASAAEKSSTVEKAS